MKMSEAANMRRESVAKPASTKAKTTEKTPVVAAAVLPAADVLAYHRHYTALGETRALFGYVNQGNDQVAAVTLPLESVTKATNGRAGMEWAVTHKATDDGTAKLFADDGHAVRHGKSCVAPTGGKQQANACARVTIIGDGLPDPITFSLSPVGVRSFATSDTETIDIPKMGTRSFMCRVSVPASGDEWRVSTCRIFAGGALPETAVELLALAALDAGETGEAALVGAADVITGKTPRNASRATRRASVSEATRAKRERKPRTKIADPAVNAADTLTPAQIQAAVAEMNA